MKEDRAIDNLPSGTLRSFATFLILRCGRRDGDSPGRLRRSGCDGALRGQRGSKRLIKARPDCNGPEIRPVADGASYIEHCHRVGLAHP